MLTQEHSTPYMHRNLEEALDSRASYDGQTQRQRRDSAWDARITTRVGGESEAGHWVPGLPKYYTKRYTFLVITDTIIHLCPA